MNDQHMTATQMMWQPKMLRLTQIAAPFLDNGATTLCAINPADILLVYRGMSRVVPPEGVEKPELICCTVVVARTGHHLAVQESVQQVLFLRDTAMGHKPNLEPLT